MKKDEIIELLKEQLQLANEQLQQANTTVSSLTLQVNELIERIKSLEELLVQKGIAIDKANRQNAKRQFHADIGMHTQQDYHPYKESL